ncbi:succinate-semialdehyde dehydrogenase / glutarate-semialdehyde dehydrogenase [Entomortierella parvispora]|uniref:Succinate-semialdehyde dehydrogenase n=1 Tax=Entomortierella parvispora TaxID=205924 RepID=A0A9P3HCF9_9FUNG|nr:succinate-semialdehyde dehydrogenase / glutarate-semialdehyde dehydrogenase [Entomortierella parvispora]
MTPRTASQLAHHVRPMQSTSSLGSANARHVRCMSILNSHGQLELKDKSLLIQAGFIDNTHVKTTASGKRFPVFDPARGVEIASFPDMNTEDAERAIQAAKNALPEWSQKTAKERSAILRKWYDLILQNEDDLARILTWENGKPLAEALGEIRYGASFFEWFSEEAKRLYGEVIPSPSRQQRMMAIRQPLGVVGIITPWNFPNAMITRKFGAALAVGCTVVAKPASETPLSALALCELGMRAGVPKGVIGIVTTHTDTKAIGKHFCESLDISGISFTGSTAVGKVLLKQSADTVKKMSLELGGNAAFIVFEDADLEKAVDAAIMAKFRSSGQTCICVNRFYVHSSIKDKFASLMGERVKKFQVGSGFDNSTTHGPLINQRAVEKVHSHVEDALQHGAKLVTGGTHDKDSSADSGIHGYFYPPTVLADMKTNMKMATEETFGPVAGIFSFETEDEVLEAANKTRFGLAGYFFSNDVSRCWRVAEKLQVGMVGVNTGAISSEVAPFGGIKESGMGREGARQGLDEYTQYKYINMAV